MRTTSDNQTCACVNKGERQCMHELRSVLAMVARLVTVQHYDYYVTFGTRELDLFENFLHVAFIGQELHNRFVPAFNRGSGDQQTVSVTTRFVRCGRRQFL